MKERRLPKQNIFKTIKSAHYMMCMIWKRRKGKTYIVLSSLLSVINASFPIVLTIFPGFIINELVGERRFQILLFYVGVLLLSPLLRQFINIIIERKLTNITMVLRNSIEKDFYIHLSHVDFEYRESPEIEMKGGRAKDTLQSSIIIVTQLFGFLSAILSMIMILSVVSTLNPLIILMIVVIMYVNSIVTKYVNVKQYSLKLESDRLSRYLLVFSNPLEQYLYAKEMKLFHLTDYMIDKKIKTAEEDNKVKIKNDMYRNTANIFYTCTSLIQQVVLYAYLIYNVLFRGLAVGTMSIYLTASAQFSGALNKIFNSYLTMANNSPRVQELIEYLELPLKETHSGSIVPIFDKDSVLEFQDVSFKYPGQDRYVLKHLNLTIYGKEKLCIVGVNGSGKSTFIKLLTRLYSPTEGKILLNGVDVTEYDFQKYQRLFAPVFQNFQMFSGLTIRENIILANSNNEKKLDEVCIQSGVLRLVNKLPKGYDTYIDKWVDEEGINPSGGEEQRIAIARACYHGGEIFLLDEPTAALDPMAEYEIYTQFNKMITDKCAVLITHRLSAVQLADKVAVFDNGSVVEYGTHKELYEKGGIYTEMFDKQAQFYRDEKNSGN